MKLNLISLNDRRTKLNLQWAKNGIKHETLTDLFPKNDKMHLMTTRKSEMYKVGKFNTERMKKSSVVYMRQLLNEQVAGEQQVKERKSQKRKR